MPAPRISRHAGEAFACRASVTPVVARRMIADGIASGFEAVTISASGALLATTRAPRIRVTIGRDALGERIVVTAVPRGRERGRRGSRGRVASNYKRAAAALDWWREQRRFLCHDL